MGGSCGSAKSTLFSLKKRKLVSFFSCGRLCNMADEAGWLDWQHDDSNPPL